MMGGFISTTIIPFYIVLIKVWDGIPSRVFSPVDNVTSHGNVAPKSFKNG